MAVALLAFAALVGPAAAQEGIVVSDTSTSVDFPERVTFRVEASSSVPITGVELRYQVQALACGVSTATGLPDFEPASDLTVEWTWDLKERGGLPAGATVVYWWELTDTEGRTLETPETTFVFEDPRFTWRSIAGDYSVIHWYSGGDSFAEELLATADAGILTLQESTGVLPSRQVHVRIYESAAAMRDALVFSHEWTGGVAFPSHGLVSIGINAGNLAWGRRAMVHEMTHVVLGETAAFCGSAIPAWLNEGLATFNEGEVEPFYSAVLSDAINDDSAFSVVPSVAASPTPRMGPSWPTPRAATSSRSWSIGPGRSVWASCWRRSRRWASSTSPWSGSTGSIRRTSIASGERASASLPGKTPASAPRCAHSPRSRP